MRNKRILGEVLSDYRRRERENEEKAFMRAATVYRKHPDIAEIDTMIRTTMLRVVRAAFDKSVNPTQEVEAARRKNTELQIKRAEALVAAGLPYNYLDTVYDCPNCSDTGYINDEPCPCLKSAYEKACVKDIEKTLPIPEATFSGFKTAESEREQMNEVLQYCRNYTADECAMVLMTGKSGLGKTYLACAMAREAARRDELALFESAYTIAADYEDEKFGRASGETEKYEKCGILFIDDLGNENPSAFSANALYRLLDTRLRAHGATVITTALGIDALRHKYGEQLLTRVISGMTLNFIGESMWRA